MGIWVYNILNSVFLNILKGEDLYGSKLQQTVEIAYRQEPQEKRPAKYGRHKRIVYRQARKKSIVNAF